MRGSAKSKKLASPQGTPKISPKPMPMVNIQMINTSSQPKDNFIFMKLNVTKGWDG